MAKIKFPSEMPLATNIGADDKLMISKAGTGESFQATFNQAKNYLNITGTDLKPIPSGALPTPESGQVRKMEVVGPGTWTHASLAGGEASLLEGEMGTFYFDGSVWSLVNVQELPKSDGTDEFARDVLYPFSDNEPTAMPTTPNEFGILRKSDGVVVPDGTASRVIKYSVGTQYKAITFKGYQSQANQANVNNYSTILVKLEDDTFVELLPVVLSTAVKYVFNGTLNFPDNTKEVYVAWSNIGVALNSEPEILFEKVTGGSEGGVKKYIDEQIDLVKSDAGDFTESVNFPLQINFESDNFYDITTLGEPITINLDPTKEHKFGKTCVLKLIGGNISFGPDFIVDEASDTYNPSIGNIVYCFYEYQKIRVIIKNSDAQGYNPVMVQKILADFEGYTGNVKDYTPNKGDKFKVDSGSFNVTSGYAQTTSAGDNSLAFSLEKPSSYDISVSVTMTTLFAFYINHNIANVTFTRSNNRLNYIDTGGVTRYVPFTAPTTEFDIIVQVRNTNYITVIVEGATILSNYLIRSSLLGSNKVMFNNTIANAGKLHRLEVLN